MPNLKDVKQFNYTLLKILFFTLHNKIMELYLHGLYLRLNNKDDLVAQLVEHLPFKERVLGSSPSQVTIFAHMAELVDALG